MLSINDVCKSGYHHVWNDEIIWTTRQPYLSAVVHARRFSLFGHIAQTPDGTAANNILTAAWRTGGNHWNALNLCG